MRKTITDEDGHEYKLSYTKYDDKSFDLEIWDGKYSVGVAVSTTRDEDTLVLDQITINTDDENEERTQILGAPKNTNSYDYRNKDLGTKLLIQFIGYARKLKFKRIYLSIVKRDISKIPFLPKWYKEYGFVECTSYENHTPGAVMFLKLDL